jgi:hypothetical protein
MGKALATKPPGHKDMVSRRAFVAVGESNGYENAVRRNCLEGNL